VQNLLHDIVLFPFPFAGHALDGSPRNVVLTGNQAEIFEMNLELNRGSASRTSGRGKAPMGEAWM